MKRILPVGILSVVVALIFTACKPQACFTSSKQLDNLHVGEEVTFDGGCSEKSADYSWEVATPSDTSIYFSRAFTRSFKDSGLVNVSLTVVNSNKSDFSSQTFLVTP